MNTIDELDRRLKAVEQRNAKVTSDKAWEISVTRRLSIAALTYAVVVIYLVVIRNIQPFINAIVPVMGYLLSTLVLARVKHNWTQRARVIKR